MHRFTVKKSIVLFLLVAVGSLFGFSLLQTESAVAAPVAIRAAQPTPPPLIFLSSNVAVNVDGVRAADEDILRFASGTFTLYFDGSDVGVGGADVDAFELVNAGMHGGILMSFEAPIRLVLDGTSVLVDDSDIVKFTFEGAPGTSTSGSFTSCFDGSDFGLTTAGEDIDAIAFDADGRLVISPVGLAKVNGTSLIVADEDLVAFGSGPFSCNPAAGTWALLIDGTDLALSAAAEDVGGAWIDVASPDKNIYLSTKGNFQAVDGV